MTPDMTPDITPPGPATGATRGPAPTMASRRDTAEGCRERAAADLLASVAMLTVNQRERLESSAASWTVRAEMLKGIEDSFAKRTAVANAALASDGESPAPERC